MSTALILIATRPLYWGFAERMIASAKTYLVPHDVVLFTDSDARFDVAHQIKHPGLGFPDATLLRYHAVTSQHELLSKYDNLFYSDADMLFVSPVQESDIFSDGITATQHPGYHARDKGGTPERNPASAAYVAGVRTYFCGGFNGGTSEAYLRMATSIRHGVDTDRARGITAVWHDESHLNRYLFDHPPAKVLSPAFCYPEGYGGGYGWPANQYKPVLIALEKGPRR